MGVKIGQDKSSSKAEKVALSLPCRRDEHYPYQLRLIEAGDGLNLVHAWVRTESGDWDGCGGRTDLHEILATMWAALLRANGVASAELLDDEGWCGPEEIYSRALAIRQPFDSFIRSSEHRLFERIQAHTSLACHLLYDAFQLQNSTKTPPIWQENSLPWLDDVRVHVGGRLNREVFVERQNPTWRYYRARPHGMTLVELPPVAGLRLRKAFCFYEPKTVQLGNRLIVSAGGLYNSISVPALRKAEKLLRVVDKTTFSKFSGGNTQFDSHGALIVPLESHCVIIGGSAFVIVRTDCGFRPYLRSREQWDRTTQHASAIFGQSGSFDWSPQIPSERFVDLATALLSVEPGVARVRSAGSHNDRDQGRDLIVDWRRTVDEAAEQPRFVTASILVQVKVRRKTIGKSDLRDVRDTIERHAANGYLFVGYPTLTGDLVNYLTTLRQRGEFINWWSRTELEDRLRRNMHITRRFADIVSYLPPTAQ